MDSVGTVRVLIGNGISLIACAVLVISGYVKDKNKTIFLQSVQMSLSAIVCIILNALSGTVVNLLCVPRNILAQKNRLSFAAKLIFSILLVILTIIFNTKGIIGWIPIFPTIIYTFFLDKFEGEKFKFLVIFLMSFWTVHDFLIQSYVSTVFNVLNIITSAIAVYRIRHSAPSAEEQS